jgi:Lrp/AsnC family transcriptional regulator, leucine-responsive regulatory protein
VDARDKRILRMLIGDGRVSLKKVARKMELPVTTVFNRMKKMEDAGIFRTTADLDRKKLGYGMDFYILGTVDTSSAEVDQEKMARKLAAMPGVLSAAVMTGSRDILIHATARDIDELSDMVLKKIRGIGGVAATETMVVMKEFTGRRDKLL